MMIHPELSPKKIAIDFFKSACSFIFTLICKSFHIHMFPAAKEMLQINANAKLDFSEIFPE